MKSSFVVSSIVASCLADTGRQNEWHRLLSLQQEPEDETKLFDDLASLFADLETIPVITDPSQPQQPKPTKMPSPT